MKRKTAIGSKKTYFFQTAFFSALCLSSVTTQAADKFYYASPFASNINDVLVVKNTQGTNTFNAKRFAKLRALPLRAETKLCFQNKEKRIKTIKLNLMQGSSVRSIFVENGECTSVESGWSSYGNMLSSIVKKFSGILAPDSVNDTFTASYSIGSNRNSDGTEKTAAQLLQKPFCLDNYSGKAEVQSGFYKQLYIPFKTHYNDASVVLQANPASAMEKQTQTIRNGEAVFTDVEIKPEATYTITIKQPASAQQSKPLILRTLDIDAIRMQANDEGVPMLDKKALSGNDKDEYDDEFAEILYDLNILADSEMAYFHLYALNDLYKKSEYSKELFVKAILPKIDSYKTAYCQP